ncbi:hypothetical protein ABZ614_42385 [Streptomyces sp. NPDC013178]|uniref:hypothetical protein n=1 Tax=Streptomyces sp. NPDC013178 TaxID=3155118 RepID=UPI0033E1C761
MRRSRSRHGDAYANADRLLRQALVRHLGEQYKASDRRSTSDTHRTPHSGHSASPTPPWTAARRLRSRCAVRHCLARQADEQKTAPGRASSLSCSPQPRQILSPVCPASSDGKRPALKQMERVADLTREHWQGQAADGFHLYKGKMPIVATTLELLREHGPAGPAFWRFGREGRQNLWDAIGNPRRDAALVRRAEEARRRLAQEAAEREAQRPVCADCGQKFTDDRWKASIAVDWGRGDSHPHLCDDCKARALEAERQAEQAERERQEQEAQASKIGGWLGRWRS